MEYKILHSINYHNLNHIVNDHIKSGWQLQGGVAKGVGDEVYQAVVMPKH
ncbi:DUF1737 domain-containing protein [Psychroserpens algicola]|nr:DUF1737 domain-containing protein [Psychroserpens algicola]